MSSHTRYNSHTSLVVTFCYFNTVLMNEWMNLVVKSQTTWIVHIEVLYIRSSHNNSCRLRSCGLVAVQLGHLTEKVTQHTRSIRKGAKRATKFLPDLRNLPCRDRLKICQRCTTHAVATWSKPSRYYQEDYGGKVCTHSQRKRWLQKQDLLNLTYERFVLLTRYR